MIEPKRYLLADDGVFPNSRLPVLHYRKALKLPIIFPAASVKNTFRSHGWSNSWRMGIYTYQHYHSITHEVIGVVKGKTTLQLGGEHGKRVTVRKGDVLVIPAGVAHKNLGKEKAVICVGAYPDGKDYDMNYGRPGERPQADKNIAAVPLPQTDPVFGTDGLTNIWK
jgi:uncharacterized protein YjlB